MLGPDVLGQIVSLILGQPVERSYPNPHGSSRGGPWNDTWPMCPPATFLHAVPPLSRAPLCPNLRAIAVRRSFTLLRVAHPLSCDMTLGPPHVSHFTHHRPRLPASRKHVPRSFLGPPEQCRFHQHRSAVTSLAPDAGTPRRTLPPPASSRRACNKRCRTGAGFRSPPCTANGHSERTQRTDRLCCNHRLGPSPSTAGECGHQCLAIPHRVHEG